MTRSIFRAVALISALAVLASPVTAQADSPSASTPATATSTNVAKVIETLSCYQNPNTLTSQGDYDFQSSGYCQEICVALGKPVMATSGGSTCYCGDELPSSDQEVDLSNCDTPCTGYVLETCGGIGFWQLYLTGFTADVETASNSTTSTSSSAMQGSGSSATGTITLTKPTTTVVVTQSATSSPEQKKSSVGCNSSPLPWMSLVLSVLPPLLVCYCK